MKFNTLAIHGGAGNDPQTGAVSFPIYQTSTYSQEVPGNPRIYQNKELSYGRSENPTRTAFENAVAALEGAQYGSAYASGLAAISAVLHLLKSGDHIVAVQDLYGGAYRQFTKIYTGFELDFSFVDTTNLENIEAAITNKTRFLWLESPSNPLLNITDIQAACEIAKRHGVISIVDNTFASPYLQNPLSLGADIVLHSATKYIGGHSDVVGGIVLTNNREYGERLRFIQNAVGAIPGPQDCFLLLRGVKTLGVRMDRHCQSAFEIARHLETHPKVSRVYYPGLESHRNHEIAKKQMSLYGAIVSFELDADLPEVFSFLCSLKLLTLAESLGGVKSLICHPPSMTHASVEPDVRRKAGVSDGLIRLSVGLEDAEDLIADLDEGLEFRQSGNGEKLSGKPVKGAV
ncbi:PLP-dependent aspartate aminotransferase family protein [bacterium]|nr:PLP-dependent aspartate aminotransferase family protein [bacterium]